MPNPSTNHPSWGKFILIMTMFTLAVIACAVVAALWFFPAQQSILPAGRVVINGHALRVELAETAMQQTRGLSFRSSLGRDDGMLFVFGGATSQTFWMHGMKFPLDIIFLRDNRVINIAAAVPPPSIKAPIPAVVSSEGPADTVLELNAGRAAELGLVPGSVITLER